MATSCPHCGHELADTQAGTATCAACGRDVSGAVRPLWATGMDPIRRYFHDLWQIITHPTAFFRRMPLTGGVSRPLAFALVTHWLGSAVGFLWNALIGGAFQRHFTGIMKMAGDVAEIDSPGRSDALQEFGARVANWFWGAGSVIADPFLTSLSILFTTLLVFVGARILVTPGKNGAPEVTFESALRVICYGMSPAILAVIPLVGSPISALVSAVVTIIGAREVYRIGNGRAIVVALFPKVLFLGIMMAGLFFVALLMLKFFASAF